MKGNIDKSSILQNTLVLPDQPFRNDFLETMRRVLRWSRLFGVMGPGTRWWKAWSLLLLMALVSIEVGAIWKVIKALAGWAVDTIGHRSVTARLSGTMFYTSALASLIFSSKLYLSWDSLQTYWVSIERAVHVNIPQDEGLKKRMIRVVIIMGVCSYVEHAMSVISLVELDCPPDEILRRYVMRSHGFLFLRSDYTVWIAIPLLFISNIATALWNFQDALIILISLGLASRYKRLNEHVAKVCSTKSKDSDQVNTAPVKVYNWRKIREAYVKQAALVRKVDGYIGSIILLSSFGNFYFICLQLFLGITQGLYGATILKLVYYLVSLGWLILRFSWMILSAAEVHVQSRLALQYIHTSSSISYNIEVERLHNQLRKDFVALTGMGFYYINRTILLKMAASVVTYELVLIQFDNKGSDH